MRAFLTKYSYVVVWVCILIIVGAGFVLVIQPSLGPLVSLEKNPVPPVAPSAIGATPIPPTPSVTLTIQKSKSGNTLWVQWANLPSDTTALNIFRGTKNATSGWSLWKTLTLTPGDLASGSASINLGKDALAGYLFYVQAVSGNGNGTSTGNGSGSGILWTSSVSTPVVTTSTPETAPPSGVPSNGNTNGTSTNQSTSTNNNGNNNQTSTPPPPQSGPTGTPFYNPQVQIEGYAPAQSNNFWVQHIDQKIQIGWQNLPPQTTSIVVLRSPNQDGPWSVVLTQKNPGVNGSYSIQIVDDTLGNPYFYEMNAVAVSTTIATYGPVYLAPGR